jgi:hypothetical protein
MPYLLDADIFIRAKNLHYGLDFCPAFWDWLLRAHSTSRVFSIEKVLNDLEAGADELATWASAAPVTFFRPPDASVLPSLGAVSTWATSRDYEPAAISTFLQVSDYYLVAQALAYGFTVVSHEIPSASIRRIKIPDACLGVGVSFMTPFEMLRRERARFVLS